MGGSSFFWSVLTGTLTQNRMQVWEAQFYGLREHCRLSADDEESRIISEAISCNSTAFLDCSNPEKTVALGNPTEGALLLWLKDAGCDYLEIREQCEVLAQVPFSTERKYMATVVRSKELGCNVLYVKGAPEIVYGLCTSVTGDVAEAEIRASLAGYQAKAMRTHGFARPQLNEGENPNVDRPHTDASCRRTAHRVQLALHRNRGNQRPGAQRRARCDRRVP